MTTDTFKNTPSPLPQCLDFTDEDLADNQQGRISARQQQRLRKQEQRKLLMAGTAIGVILLFVAGSAIKTFISRDSSNYGAAVLLVILMLAGAYVIMSERWQRWQSVQADLTMPDRQVSTLTGPVRTYSQKLARTSTVYMASIMNEAIEIPESAMFAFQHGERYHIYVTKASRAILSAEVAGPEIADPERKRL
jgi:hypothetical protein